MDLALRLAQRPEVAPRLGNTRAKDRAHARGKKYRGRRRKTRELKDVGAEQAAAQVAALAGLGASASLSPS